MPFKTSNIDDATRALTHRRSTPDHFIRDVLVMLSQIGFDRTRFYEVAFDVPAAQAFVVLTAVEPNDQAAKIGYQVPLSSSTLRKRGVSDYPVVADADEVHESWVRELDLLDRTWVEIPVQSMGEVIGVIACDWLGRGRHADLTDGDLRVLALLGHQVGAFLAAAPFSAVPNSFPGQNLAARYSRFISAGDLVEQAGRDLMMAIDASIVAVFHYNWLEGRLRKTKEFTNPALGLEADVFPESYRPGEFLTGSAWLDEQMRYISDFESLSAHDKRKIADESKKRHELLLSCPVRSVLYLVLGSEKQFLLRFINRAQLSALPFIQEKRLADRFASELTSLLDAAIYKKRAEELRSVARSAVENLSDPGAMVRSVARGLAEEDIVDFAFLCHSERSRGWTFAHLAGPTFAGYAADPSAAWDDDPLYSEMVGRESLVLTDVSKFGDVGIARCLLARSARSVLSVPIRAGTTRGVLLMPVLRSASGRSISFELMQRYGSEPMRTVTAYAGIVGTVIEAARSHLSVEGARRAIGYLGHELGTPLAELGESAVYAVARSTEVLAERSEGDAILTSALAELDALDAEIEESRRDLGRILDVATLVAQESQGQLQIHLRRVPLFDVLRSAHARLRPELARADSRGRPRYDIIFSDSCRRLPEVVCDESLMRQVFLNVMRNAMKYSLPRFPGEPMIIRVFGQPQPGVCIVQVANWGIGVPDDQFEAIFQPFVRGQVVDRLKAIRGMGLGLYLSRKIMAAHDGSIFCAKSRFTLDDIERERLMEGFETVFEIRLPVNLQEGTKVYVSEGTTW